MQLQMFVKKIRALHPNALQLARPRVPPAVQEEAHRSQLAAGSNGVYAKRTSGFWSATSVALGPNRTRDMQSSLPN